MPAWPRFRWNDSGEDTARKRNNAFLDLAKTAFGEKHYDECVNMLAKWEGTPSDEVESLRLRQLFKEAVQIDEKLAGLEKSQPSDAWLSVLEAVRQFVAERPPDELDLESASRIEGIEGKMAILDARYQFGMLSAPEEMCEDWAQKAKQSLDVYSTPQLEQKVLRLLTSWFAATHSPRSPKKVGTCKWRSMETADCSKGISKPQENGRWYKFFAMKTKEAARQDPNAWGTKMASASSSNPPKFRRQRSSKITAAAKQTTAGRSVQTARSGWSSSNG